MNIRRKQKGASAIGLIIILIILGVGIYIGLQYIPQTIEAGSVESILASIERDHNRNPANSVSEVWGKINSQLEVNQMDDLRKRFNVTQLGGEFVIEVSYERELDLIYEKKTIHYDKSVSLK